MKKYNQGITLMELMITLVIVAIIMAIAYPSYQDQMEKARRAEGREFLLRIAAAQERFYTNNNRYSNSFTTVAAGGLGVTSNMSERGHYQVNVVLSAGNQEYALTAVPQATQASDTTCANLTLNSRGVRGASGTAGAAGCWR